MYTRGAGAVQCPDEAMLRKAVAKRLGYDPFFPSADRTIVASIVLEGERLKGQAQLVDVQGIVRGTREYFGRSDRCEELVYALALSISISIDPASAESPKPPRAQTPPSDAGNAGNRSQPASASAEPIVVSGQNLTESSNRGADESPERAAGASSASESKTGLHWSAGVDARSWFRALPGVSLGSAASIAARWSRWSGLVELGAMLPTSAELAAGESRVSVNASQAWVALAPCGHWDPFFACGILMTSRFAVHRMDIEGVGDTTTVTATGGRLGVEVAASEAVGARFQGDLLATLVRTPVTLDGKEVWRAPPWSASLSLAVVFHFP